MTRPSKPMGFFVRKSVDTSDHRGRQKTGESLVERGSYGEARQFFLHREWHRSR
jgi:hypothetical protein